MSMMPLPVSSGIKRPVDRIMWHFLTFDFFVAIPVLLLGYYLGAVLLPLALWLSRHYLLSKFSLLNWIDQQRNLVFKQLSRRDRAIVIVLLLLIFVAMEIIWRMMFEAMIGYFQMHDFLKSLAASQSATCQ